MSDPPARAPVVAPVVAVIGGGFSGLLTAIHLLRREPRAAVRLVERAQRFGRGRAYEAGANPHLLNVRAGNMSAFPDRPRHFVEWLAAQGEPAGADSFVTRSRYGDYLQGLLREEIGDPDRAGRLLLEADEAVALRRVGSQWRVELALGRAFEADACVLAVGLAPPADLPGAEAAALAAPAYVPDPWASGLDDLPRGQVLLLGSGLTMVDLALALAAPDRRLLAISPRGLISRSHGPTRPSAAPEGPLDTARAALATLRRHAEAVGWREAVDSVRPATVAIWRAWPLAERRRFLRHLRAWWDVHRHRMAPAVAARLADLAADGQLTIGAGRLERLGWDGHGFQAAIRGRGEGKAQAWRFDAVVNCTGPSGGLPGGSALLADLVGQGAVRADPLGLGAEVDAAFRALGADGRPTPGLFAVGPLTRGAVWESSAVPDLRSQTAEVAAAVLACLERA
ncbi:MAG: FAD/NAD(P)-binding protein [Caulobacterales bacterium]|nr:FAD/NAD(P)-binding protein [Caulobacterales bacterium]